MENSILDPQKIHLIEDCLRKNPRGISITDLSTSIGMNRNHLAKYLDILLISGIVDMESYGKVKAYFLSHRVSISSMLEFTSDCIISFDSDLRVTQINEKFLQLLKENRESILGKKLDDIHNGFLDNFPTEKIMQYMHGSTDMNWEFCTCIDDSPSYFHVKFVPSVLHDGGRGLTCIIEDISAKKKAEAEKELYIKKMEFFNRKLQEFIELPHDADLFYAIGAGLDELIPNTIIDINAYDAVSKTLRLKAIFGKRSKEFVERCSENNICWDHSPAYDFVAEVLKTGKLFHLPGKLYYASFEQISIENALILEDEFNLGDFYSVGLFWRENLLGNILFILQKDEPLRNSDLIEVYARAASIVLQRQYA